MYAKDDFINMFTVRNAELLYIIEAARKQREEEDLAAGGAQHLSSIHYQL